MNDNAENIKNLINHIHTDAGQMVNNYSGIVFDIISGKSTTEKEIDILFTQMLDWCFYDNMLNLYKQLCQYTISEETIPRFYAIY